MDTPLVDAIAEETYLELARVAPGRREAALRAFYASELARLEGDPGRTAGVVEAARRDGIYLPTSRRPTGLRALIRRLLSPA